MELIYHTIRSSEIAKVSRRLAVAGYLARYLDGLSSLPLFPSAFRYSKFACNLLGETMGVVLQREYPSCIAQVFMCILLPHKRKNRELSLSLFLSCNNSR